MTNSPLNFISLNCGSLRSNAKKAEFLAPVNEQNHNDENHGEDKNSPLHNKPLVFKIPCLLINAQSIVNKMGELTSLANSLKPMIIQCYH